MISSGPRLGFLLSTFASVHGLRLAVAAWNSGAPESLRLNHWALAGEWTVGRRAALCDAADASIVFRFHARDVHLVMGPRARDTSVPFRVLVDGEPPGAARGLDVDERGHGTLSQQRLYQLVRERGSITDRTFEITFLAPGVEAYAFTFG